MSHVPYEVECCKADARCGEGNLEVGYRSLSIHRLWTQVNLRLASYLYPDEDRKTGLISLNETRNLARWVVGLEYRDIPEEVIAKAKALILDSFGSQLGGSVQPSLKKLLRYVRIEGGSPEATVVNYGDRTSAYHAALLNGAFNHGFEFDDHPHNECCTVVPAQVMGERELCSGREFITAAIAGYEVFCHIAAAGNPGFMKRGWHAQNAQGPIAAATAAGKVLKLDEEQMDNAISLGVSQCGGTFQHSQRIGGEAKRAHGGLGASSGVRAALLAKEGFTGAREILEGDKGYYRAFCGEGEYDLTKLLDGIGKEYLILNSAIKTYSCCAAQWEILDLVSRLRKENNIQPEDVEQIEIGTSPLAMWMVGTINEPDNCILSAQFSARFGVALNLTTGSNLPKDYLENVPPSEAILALMKKINMAEDEEVSQESQPAEGRLLETVKAKATIKLKNGKVIRGRTGYGKGYPQNPITTEELQDKFRLQATLAQLPETKQKKIIEAVNALEDLEDISTIVPLLVR